MSNTYLNGTISLTSLAAPTAEDLAKVQALSEDDRHTLIAEALKRGQDAPLSDRSTDDIWRSALKKAKSIKSKPEYAV